MVHRGVDPGRGPGGARPRVARCTTVHDDTGESPLLCATTAQGMSVGGARPRIAAEPPETSCAIWLAHQVDCPGAEVRLLCLPHAGAGAALFRHWSQAFAPRVEVCAVQLPGRENRSSEPALASLPVLVDRLAGALAGQLDRRFAIFGHSMGALIGFELARELRRRRQAAPAHLFLASYCAPQLLRRESRAGSVKQEAALRLATAASVPRHMRGELLELVVPTIEADTRLCEDYEYAAGDPLDCPITVFRGHTDYVLEDQIAGWRAHTRGPFKLQTFLGDHFFVRDTPRGVMQAIHKALTGGPGSAR
jgi:medium-chain acyl-[acyl-carrier-protein] hydrolase